MPTPQEEDRLRRRRVLFSVFYMLFAFGLMWALQTTVLRRLEPREVPYSELMGLLRDGRVESVELRAATLIATLKPKEEEKASKTTRPEVIVANRLPGIDETQLLPELEKQKATFAGKIETSTWWEQLLYAWVAPLAMFGVLYWLIFKRVGKGVGPLSFGKNQAKIYDASEKDRVTFEDVAGVDEALAELVEVVDFLEHPDKYLRLGARIPKGVLLVGPPGTGKTLLAKAVAGQARVPFFTLSGSAFVEMFVGVGAARMRDLFEQAKQRAPCIVFIDELDAIGKTRGGAGVMAGHDEREQTLNQLLVEMDGFDSKGSVILMAATNRPEVLDPALLRAGRFDRHVLVDRPDLRGREEILRVHVRHAKLSPDVNLGLIARRTPGMVGADLANVVNEAALGAARRESELVEQRDFEESIDRIQLGLKKRGRVMSDDEKHRVAYHESGHALVALSVKHSDPVHRVTIIPRSIGALGATLQLPTEDRYLMTRTELLDRICVMLGGRAAEELSLGDMSTGAQNDLERATELARQMVCRFGMTDALGPMTYGRPGSPRFLDGALPFGDDRSYSEETARSIDSEIRSIVEAARSRALGYLTEHKATLERIATRLLLVETLDREELENIVNGNPAPAKELSP